MDFTRATNHLEESVQQATTNRNQSTKSRVQTFFVQVEWLEATYSGIFFLLVVILKMDFFYGKWFFFTYPAFRKMNPKIQIRRISAPRLQDSQKLSICVQKRPEGFHGISWWWQFGLLPANPILFWKIPSKVSFIDSGWWILIYCRGVAMSSLKRSCCRSGESFIEQFVVGEVHHFFLIDTFSLKGRIIWSWRDVQWPQVCFCWERFLMQGPVENPQLFSGVWSLEQHLRVYHTATFNLSLEGIFHGSNGLFF